MVDDTQYRLPRTVTPSRYELTLEPDLDSAAFRGFESVSVDVHEPVGEVVVNALDLEIDEAWLEGSGGERLDATVTIDKETERAHLALDGTASPGAWTLHARFRGVLNDKLRGFYRSTFTDASGTKRVIAVTQFESTDARRAFPCWDEPEAKAVFAITLVVDADLTAISNAREIAREDSGGRRTVRFADTMKMSPYLVAFVVGPLEATPRVDVDGTPVRIVHPPGMGHLTDYALEVTTFALRFFSDFYGIPYPGDKLDLVAVPDFAFGAMENLGCITFREVLLLVDPKAVTQPELQSVCDVIAHELAHMWFGNLVTMKWWNGIWLNEAFATFMEMLATDAFRPEWERWVNFGLSRTAAFDVDSLESTRPIEFPVVSPSDADGMFDILTYEKGAAVVRMLQRYLGDDAFRDGIRHYLLRHRFGNTETTDLWDALEEVTGQPTRRIMDSWIFQGGYPVVTVSLAGDRTRLRLRQERFRYHDGDTERDDHPGGRERWAIPMIVCYGAGGATRVERLLFERDLDEVTLGFPAEWVLANVGGSGFYRVTYSTDLLSGLTSRGANHLTSIERYGLVDDTYASVLAGLTTTTEFLDFVRGFGDETDVSVWQRVIAALGALDRLLDGEARQRYQVIVRGLLAPALQRLGWDPSGGEGDRVRQLRGSLFEALGTLGDDRNVFDRARALHARHLDGTDAVDPALAAAAISVLAHGGDESDWEAFRARVANAPTPQEEQRYLYALARFDQTALVARTLDLCLTSEVRSQNVPYMIRLALLNRRNGGQAWDFVRRNWDALLAKLPDNNVVRMLEGIRVLTAPEVAADVRAFFAEHEVPAGHKTLAQHLDRLQVNIALREREAASLAAHLLS